MATNIDNTAGKSMIGTGKDDVIKGDVGNDVLLGKAGNDELWGGLGDDTVDGGSGDDWLFGVSAIGADGTESPVSSAVPGGPFVPRAG